MLVYVTILLLSSISVSFRENSATPFFRDGIGGIVAGSDKALADATAILIQKKGVERDFGAMLRALGELTLIYYMLRISYMTMTWLFSDYSPVATRAFGAFLTLAAIQTIYNAIVTGNIIFGMSGLITWALNFDSFAWPVADWLAGLGSFFIRSPIL